MSRRPAPKSSAAPTRRAAAPRHPTLTWPGRDQLDQEPDPAPAAPRPWLNINAATPGARSGSLLIHADNLPTLAWLAQQPASHRPRLITIDPPYATQVDHAVRTGGRDVLAYADTWDMPAYLSFLLVRLRLMHRALRDDGFLFVQCDWRASACVRLLLDEVFSPACFRNEIVWRRAPNLGRQAASLQLGRTADSIFVYSKAPAQRFPGPAPSLDVPVPLTSTGRPRGARQDSRTGEFFTTAPRGDYTDESIERLRAQGRIHQTASGKVFIRYALVRDAQARWCKRIPVDTIWSDADVRPLRHASRDELSVGYVTQKPLSLLRRIIAWATAPGDLVADIFCGSGTALVAAHELGRPFLGCDSSPVAAQVSCARLARAGAPFQLATAPGAHPMHPVAPAFRAATQPPSRRPRVTRGKARAARAILWTAAVREGHVLAHADHPVPCPPGATMLIFDGAGGVLETPPPPTPADSPASGEAPRISTRRPGLAGKPGSTPHSKRTAP